MQRCVLAAPPPLPPPRGGFLPLRPLHSGRGHPALGAESPHPARQHAQADES